jgi:hypothetical protein
MWFGLFPSTEDHAQAHRRTLADLPLPIALIGELAIVRSSRNGEFQARLSEARHESVHRVSACCAIEGSCRRFSFHLSVLIRHQA